MTDEKPGHLVPLLLTGVVQGGVAIFVWQSTMVLSAARSRRTTPVCPGPEARWSGVAPNWSLRLVSAPESIKRAVSSSLPLLALYKRAVRPCDVVALTLAPLSKSVSTSWLCPAEAAII